MARLLSAVSLSFPKADRTAKGTNIVNLLPLDPGERVSALLRGRELSEDRYIMFFTRNGVVKRMRQSELRNIRSNGIRALEIREGDALIAAIDTDGDDEMMMVTRLGMSVRFSEKDVRPMGRTAAGVRGIRLREGDRVVGALRATAGADVLLVSEKGLGKRTDIGEYTIQNRGGLGLKTYKVTDRTGCLIGAVRAEGDEDLMLINSNGTIIRMAVADISRQGRATQGVRLMKAKKDEDTVDVVAIALAEREDAGLPEETE